MKLKAKIEDSDRGWGSVFKRVKEARSGRVKVGVLADDARGSDDHGGLTVAELAALLHFGTEDIPARPWLAIAFDQQRQALTDMGTKLLGKVILEGMRLEQALGLMGAKLSAEAKKVITIGGQLAPNAPATIEAKGSDRPLVDTGRLVNANTWVIDKDR